MRAADSGMSSRSALFHNALRFRLPQFLIACWAPSLLIFAFGRRLFGDSQRLASMAALFAIPLITVFSVAYVGDDYPRYLLITVPPSLFILATSLDRVRVTRFRFGALTLIIVFGAGTMVPDTFTAMRSPGSPNTLKGDAGSKAASSIINSFTKPDDLILAPETVIPYLRGRRVLNIESFEPYPGKHGAALQMMSQVRAAIIRQSADQSPIINRFIKALETGGATQIEENSYVVYLITQSTTNCSAEQLPLVTAATSHQLASARTRQWTIEGGCWDPATVRVEFKGLGCEAGCILSSGAIMKRTKTRLEGIADVPPGYYYSVRVSGKNAAWSEAVGLSYTSTTQP
jgi:hypothetical protein